MLIGKYCTFIQNFQAVMRDLETKAVVEEADIRNMELQLQRKMFEQVSSLSFIL